MAEKVVIIGSGPAGWAAAIYASRANLAPLVYEGAITEENRVNGTLPLGQLSLTTEVENYPGFPAGRLDGFLTTAIDPTRLRGMPPLTDQSHPVTGPELMELMRQQATNFETRIVTDDIIDVDLDSRPMKVISLEGRTVETETLIVATGARANYLGLPSEDAFKNRGVSACAVCDGALPRFRNRPLVVVGGGDSAIEEATYLAKYASAVYLVHRRDELRASQIMQKRAIGNPKIEIVWSHVVNQVLGDEQQGVTGVSVRSTKDDSVQTLEATGMFLAIGHTPNTDFLKGKLETTAKGYIQLTEPFRTWTSKPGVFAAGDVADDYYRQAITSAGSGCRAALDAERYLASSEA